MEIGKAALLCGVGLCVGLALSAFKKARNEQIRLAQDLRKRYTLEMQKHLDTLYTYKKRYPAQLLPALAVRLQAR